MPAQVVQFVVRFAVPPESKETGPDVKVNTRTSTAVKFPALDVTITEVGDPVELRIYSRSTPPALVFVERQFDVPEQPEGTVQVPAFEEPAEGTMDVSPNPMPTTMLPAAMAVNPVTVHDVPEHPVALRCCEVVNVAEARCVRRRIATNKNSFLISWPAMSGVLEW